MISSQNKKFNNLLLTIKAILFDLDGVIIDSDSLHNEAKRATLKHYGFDVAVGKWQKIKHFATAQLFDLLNVKKKAIKKDSFIDYKTMKFNQLIQKNIKLIPNSIDTIKKFKQAKYKLALVTATRLINLENYFNQHDFKNFFDVIITAEDVKELKPNPESYLKAVKKLNLKPTDCLVIEDTDLGVLSAKQSGCWVIGKVGTQTAHKLIRAGADFIFSDFSEIKI